MRTILLLQRRRYNSTVNDDVDEQRGTDAAGEQEKDTIYIYI